MVVVMGCQGIVEILENVSYQAVVYSTNYLIHVNIL